MSLDHDNLLLNASLCKIVSIGAWGYFSDCVKHSDDVIRVILGLAWDSKRLIKKKKLEACSLEDGKVNRQGRANERALLTIRCIMGNEEKKKFTYFEP